MSPQNVALVRRLYDLINAIGWTGDDFVDPEELDPDLWAKLATDFALHGRPDVPDATVHRGRDATKEFWRQMQEVWSQIRWEPREFTSVGDTVVVDVRIVALGRGSDVPIEEDETDVFWFRAGEVVGLQGFPTREEALRAAQRPAPEG